MASNEFFNPDHQAQIRELLGDECYAERLTALAEEVNQLLKLDDQAQQSIDVHRCAGAAAMLGCNELHQIFTDIDSAGKAQNWPEFSNQLQKFRKAWPYSQQRIVEYAQSLTSGKL